jgi:hypothetical protein
LGYRGWVEEEIPLRDMSKALRHRSNGTAGDGDESQSQIMKALLYPAKKTSNYIFILYNSNRKYILKGENDTVDR